MPAPTLLPDEIKALARRNAAELTDRRWPYDVDQLAQAIAASDHPDDGARSPEAPGDDVMGRTARMAPERQVSARAPGAPANTDQPGGSGPRPRRPRATLAWGLLAVLLLSIGGAGAWWSTRPQHGPDHPRGTSAASTTTSLVVFGGDVSPEAARPEVERARAAGFPAAAIYHRQGAYRSVVEFPTSEAAAEALPRIKGLSRAARDAYMVSLATWCPNAVRSASGVTECP